MKTVLWVLKDQFYGALALLVIVLITRLVGMAVIKLEGLTPMGEPSVYYKRLMEGLDLSASISGGFTYVVLTLRSMWAVWLTFGKFGKEGEKSGSKT